jgi:hypothetical protein
LNTLVYKRTHKGDPDQSGRFGIHDCMGRVRSWAFDSVIGVGGRSPDHGHEDIALKVNWVGIGSFKSDVGLRGPLVQFQCFVRPEEAGPELKTLAPHLFQYMFVEKHVRAVLSQNLGQGLQHEIQGILRWALEQPKLSQGISERTSLTKRKC